MKLPRALVITSCLSIGLAGISIALFSAYEGIVKWKEMNHVQALTSR